MTSKLPASSLRDQLIAYHDSGIYPMHMPGHKRKLSPAEGLPIEMDVTEVEGTDDLHDATGILKDAMERTASCFHVDHTFYLVNGSTCGILAAIWAACPFGSEVIVARNCHHAVYHAIEILHLNVHWIHPPVNQEYEIYGSVPPKAVEELLTAYPASKAVILTSPTYEGVLSDIKTIASIVHAAGIPLIVDEAHGAHLGLIKDSIFPESARENGADLIIESAHKTLPSLTQTAFLHVNGNRVPLASVKHALGVFETSSPSYLLLSSLDGCTKILSTQGEHYYTKWAKALAAFEEKLSSEVHVLGHGGEDLEDKGNDIWALDPSKLLIRIPKSGRSGREMADWLRKEANFETEMSMGENVLAMTTMADDEETLLRFAQALNLLADQSFPRSKEQPLDEITAIPAPGETVCTISEAMSKTHRICRIEDAVGEVCGEYVYCYPPGVPLVIPGETITKEMVSYLKHLSETKTRIHHSGLQETEESSLPYIEKNIVLCYI